MIRRTIAFLAWVLRLAAGGGELLEAGCRADDRVAVL